MSQFDNASSWSESLFVINKLWICRKYFVFSATLIDSYIGHDEFALVNNILREYGEMKEPIKNLKALRAHQRF